MFLLTFLYGTDCFLKNLMSISGSVYQILQYTTGILLDCFECIVYLVRQSYCLFSINSVNKQLLGLSVISVETLFTDMLYMLYISACVYVCVCVSVFFLFEDAFLYSSCWCQLSILLLQTSWALQLWVCTLMPSSLCVCVCSCAGQRLSSGTVSQELSTLIFSFKNILFLVFKIHCICVGVCICTDAPGSQQLGSPGAGGTGVWL